jgi:AbrB family looped-hinge helix DNA binding protein
MVASAAKIDRAGRLTLPLKIRKELGLGEDSEVLVHVENGGLRVETREVALQRMQQYMRQFKKPGESVVNEFLAQRSSEWGESD